MKVTHTILALVILLGLGGVFYYLNQQPASPSPNEIAKKKVFSFQPDQVEEFTIEMADKPSATFRRVAAAAQPGSKPDDKTAQQWQVLNPPGVAADSSQIQPFLEGLPNSEYTPIGGGAPLSLDEYGLEKPEKVLRFKLKQGQNVTLSVGKENPSGSDKFGKLDSAPEVFLLSTYDTALQKTLFDLRDKRVFPIAMDKAQQIELALNVKDQKATGEEVQKAEQTGLPVRPGRIVLTKQSNSNWELTAPAVRTDFGNSNYVVTTLTGAQMKSAEEETPKSLSRYGLDRPAMRLTVKTAGGSTTLLVGNKAEGEGVSYYAQNSVWPVVFTITQALYDQLKQDLDSYRNRFLFDFQTANARRVELLWSQGEMRLDKRGADWFKTGTPEKKADTSKVEDFLNSIHNLRIQQFTSDKPGQLAQYGLDKPWLRVKVTFGEENKEETILFAKKDNRFYAARQGEPAVYEMAPGEPDNIEPKVKELAS